MKYLFLLVSLSLFLFASCGSGDVEQTTVPVKEKESGFLPTVEESAALKKESNAITQNLPTLMIIPSDGMLDRLGFLEEVDNQGTISYIRNYQQAMIKEADLKFVIAAIETEFANVGYPVENLEQQLKQLNNINAMDEAEKVARDVRSELMNTARPDYIVELDYELKNDSKSRNVSKSLTYILKCLDVYTNKSVSAVTRTDVGAGTETNDVPALVKSDFPTAVGELQTGINAHFKDLLANGVEITLRVAVTKESGLNIDDDCGENEIGERIIEWLKGNTVNQAYKMVKNTTTEQYFTNVRIFAQDENGNKYSAYDLAKDLKKALKQSCGLDVKNNTQSIGDAYILIEGLKQ